jgi:hypothetical protein
MRSKELRETVGRDEWGIPSYRLERRGEDRAFIGLLCARLLVEKSQKFRPVKKMVIIPQ